MYNFKGRNINFDCGTASLSISFDYSFWRGVYNAQLWESSKRVLPSEGGCYSQVDTVISFPDQGFISRIRGFARYLRNEIWILYHRAKHTFDD